MMNTKNSGFTLIELMIVVAIIGIIGAVAFPSYDSYMKKSRRADAKVGLAKIVDRQERFYIQNNVYTTAFADLGFTDGNSEEGYYLFSITTTNAGNPQDYEISAKTTGALKNSQSGDDDTSAGDCTTMTLDSTGLKLPAACW